MTLPPSLQLNRDLAFSFLKSVDRSGMGNLLDFLFASDYFTAPASTKFHNSFPGGLCLHSLNVMFAFSRTNKCLENPIPEESVIICGLLHDLCKVDTYTKTDNGYVTVKGQKGHASRSISMIEEYVKLTPLEDDIIRFHMGLFGIFTYHEHDTLKMFKAISRNPAVQLFAAVDMADSKRKTDNSLPLIGSPAHTINTAGLFEF